MTNQLDTSTVIGRRLAQRTLLMEGDREQFPRDGEVLDLTRPSPPDPPGIVRQAAKDALDQGETHYTNRSGIPELRQAIADRSSSEGFPASADSVVVTNGGAEALYITLQSVLKPGERVLIGGLSAPNVLDMIRFTGADVVPRPVSDPRRFTPDPDQVAAMPAAALLISSPSPVSGITITPDQLEQIIAVAALQDMTIILDRSLAWCSYHPPLTRLGSPEVARKMFTIGSFSTAFDMAGWRIGYFTAPAEHVATTQELKQAMSICTSAISQFAALAALQHAGNWLDARRRLFMERRDRVIMALQSGGLSVIEPDAWPMLLIDTRLVHPDDRKAAAMIARDAGVIVEPGSRYGVATAGYVRINLSAPDDILFTAVERLINFHNVCL